MPPRGFRRSRALWEQRGRYNGWRYYASREFRTALLYELQPIRLTTNDVQSTLRAVLHGLEQGTRFLFGRVLPNILRFLQARSRREWCIAGMVVLYYTAVRIIHAYLDAGPLVLIGTALVAIFTVGLSDNNNDDGMMSAYAVFNKGFQQLMGSVDADALLQQHVGGGMMGMMGAAVRGGNNNNNGRRREENDDDDDDEQILNDDNMLQDADGRELRRRRPRKKQGNRERNQHRREIQRQREAAAGLGFGGRNEQEAMNHLLDDGI